MKTALLILSFIVGLVVLFLVWRVIATFRATSRRTREVLAEINSVVQALKEHRDPDTADLKRFADHPRTRNVLYTVLAGEDRSDLFPAEFLNVDAFAESDMVFWLCHGNELGTAPDAIELMDKIRKTTEIDSREVVYYVFRYRTFAPHWASEDGWLAGVSGPFLHEEPCATVRPGTFSRFESYDSKTPEEHAEHSHESMMRHGGYSKILEETKSEERG
ncbi:MAG: hypothetical protein GY906_21150 [bacterium]|nr:hypothetical protein [bacterium]